MANSGRSAGITLRCQLLHKLVLYLISEQDRGSGQRRIMADDRRMHFSESTGMEEIANAPNQFAALCSASELAVGCQEERVTFSIQSE